MNFHSGLRHQRGRGFGSLFSGLIKGFAPLAKLGFSAGKKFLTSDFAKNIASTAAESGKKALKNLAVDLLEGKDITNTAREELLDARKQIAEKLKGSGIKRRSVTKAKTKIKKPVKRRKLTKPQKLKFNLLD